MTLIGQGLPKLHYLHGRHALSESKPWDRCHCHVNVIRAQHFSDCGLISWQDTTGKPKTQRNVSFSEYIYCDSLFSLSWVPLPLLSHDTQIQHVRESMKKYSVYTLVQNRHAYCYIMCLYLINHQEIQTSYNSWECIVQVPSTFTVHPRKLTWKKHQNCD